MTQKGSTGLYAYFGENLFTKAGATRQANAKTMYKTYKKRRINIQ